MAKSKQPKKETKKPSKKAVKVVRVAEDTDDGLVGGRPDDRNKPPKPPAGG